MIDIDLAPCTANVTNAFWRAAEFRKDVLARPDAKQYISEMIKKNQD